MHALGTKIIRLAILTAVMAAMTVIAYAYHQQAHAQANTPPAFSTISADTQLKYLFPTGAPAKLAFEGEPATDAQNDPITYRFVFNLPNLETTDVVNDHIKVGPSEALFDVSQNGNAFKIEAASGATPHAFREAYGDVTSYDITVDVYANDGTDDSAPLSFTIAAVYDASARFPSPATYQSDNRWAVSSTYETYEGPNAAGNIAITWHASEHSSNRAWSAGLAVGSPVWCWDGTGRTSTAVSSLWPGPDHNPPAQNGADDELFSVSSLEDTSAVHPTGTVAVAFRNEQQFPDFENPHDADADNVYHLRIVNDHEITYPEPDYGELGCSGSAVDISIKVKDVGPPAPPTGLNLVINNARDDNIEIYWDPPANRFLEDGNLVDFPHNRFNVQAILIAYEPNTLVFPRNITVNPVPVNPTITGIQSIRGVPGETYTIQLTLRNSEGESVPISKTITIPGPPDAPAEPAVTADSTTSINVDWEKPDDKGLEITGYSVQRTVAKMDDWQDATHSGTDTSAKISGLEPGTTYQVRVKATNAKGSSPWSATGEGSTSEFNVTLAYLFPRGESAVLELDGPLIEGANTEDVSHTFTFAQQNDGQALTPAEALLSVAGPDSDNRFSISAQTDATPTQFRDQYGATNEEVVLTATLVASGTNGQSATRQFTLKITYDDSAQFADPAAFQSNNRWMVAEAYETYEGLTDLPQISLPWTAATAGARQWSAGTPTDPTPKCIDYDGQHEADWPAAGAKDSNLFSVTSAASAQSGTATVAFRAAPDYEMPQDDEGSSPSDNTYHLRVTSTHDLHALESEENNLGCNGSAVDITITVKDVGPPVRLPRLNAQFKSDDTTQIDINWSAPTGFAGDGSTIIFPHASFNVSKYQHRYRWGTNQPWTTVDTTTTSATITGLNKTGYIIQVRAVNSEGESEWAEIIVGTPENQAPAMGVPANTGDIVYKFPDGKPAVVRYEQEPGSDPDGDPISYLFRIVLPDVSGISPLGDGLLTFTRNGNNFEIKANGEVTPAEFEDLYGTSGHYQAPVAIYSSDGDLESGPQKFAIDLYYERSAYFDDADERTADQRFTFTEPFETYEGPAAGDDLTINWSAPIAGSRSWGAGNPAGGIGCRDNAKTITNHTWPGTGNQDAAQFDAPSASTTGKNGTINPTFTNAPDFENPVDHDTDNTYLVRFYNTHNLHNPSPEYAIPSCSGSAIDLQIKVKDVGTPAPVTPTGSYSETDQSEVNLSWAAPTQFIEDGATVDFPHSAFNPSAYDYRHRPTSSDSWTQVTGATSTSATINGLTTHTLQVQVRATNSEGSSPWPEDFVTITRLPQASITALNSSITEGSSAQFQVTLDRSSSLTVNLTYSWLGGHGSTTGGTVTFLRLQLPSAFVANHEHGKRRQHNRHGRLRHRLHHRLAKLRYRNDQPPDNATVNTGRTVPNTSIINRDQGFMAGSNQPAAHHQLHRALQRS